MAAARSKRKDHLPKRCFIMARAGTDISVLERLLRERLIETVTVDTLPQDSLSFMDNLAGAIKLADFVIAVLDEKSRSANVYFELGCAFGWGKELVIVSPGTDLIPFALQQFLHVRSSHRDADALAFALDQYLSRPRRLRKKVAPIPLAKT